MQDRLIYFDVREHIAAVAQKEPIQVVRLHYLIYQLEFVAFRAIFALYIQLAMWFALS